MSRYFLLKSEWLGATTEAPTAEKAIAQFKECGEKGRLLLDVGVEV